MPKLLGLAATALVATVAFACGDKLMLLAGSARFHQVFGSSRPALILAYARGNSAVPGVVTDLALKPALKQAGYKLSSVDDPAKLDEALRNGKYDLLLVDATDAEQLEQQVKSARSRPTLLPVITSSQSEAEVKKKFRSVLRVPGTPGAYLAAIDDAMKARVKDGVLKTAK